MYRPNRFFVHSGYAGTFDNKPCPVQGAFFEQRRHLFSASTQFILGENEKKQALIGEVILEYSKHLSLVDITVGAISAQTAYVMPLLFTIPPMYYLDLFIGYLALTIYNAPFLTSKGFKS